MPQRKTRSDKGQMQWTQRDIDSITWVAEQRAARFDQLTLVLERQLGGPTKVAGQLSEATARSIVKRWQRAGFIRFASILAREPGWVWVTQKGLRALGLDYRMWEPKLGSITHVYWVNEVRLWCEQHHPSGEWIPERTLRKQELDHFPDGEYVLKGTTVAIEVELSPKEEGWLNDIIDRLCQRYSSIWYFLLPERLADLQKALAALQPEDQRRFSLVLYDEEAEDWRPLPQPDAIKRQGKQLRHQSSPLYRRPETWPRSFADAIVQAISLLSPDERTWLRELRLTEQEAAAWRENIQTQFGLFGVTHYSTDLANADLARECARGDGEEIARLITEAVCERLQANPGAAVPEPPWPPRRRGNQLSRNVPLLPSLSPWPRTISEATSTALHLLSPDEQAYLRQHELTEEEAASWCDNLRQQFGLLASARRNTDLLHAYHWMQGEDVARLIMDLVRERLRAEAQDTDLRRQ
jgi:hypothetical protein